MHGLECLAGTSLLVRAPGIDGRHSAKPETCANEGDEEMACFTGTWEVEDIQDDVSTLYADTAGGQVLMPRQRELELSGVERRGPSSQ